MKNNDLTKTNMYYIESPINEKDAIEILNLFTNALSPVAKIAKQFDYSIFDINSKELLEDSCKSNPLYINENEFHYEFMCIRMLNWTSSFAKAVKIINRNHSQQDYNIDEYMLGYPEYFQERVMRNFTTHIKRNITTKE